MFYSLLQINNYPPPSGKKQEKEDKLIQGIYDQKFLRLE